MNVYCGWWHAAFRKTPCGTILEDQKTPFTVIPNTATMCAMDPFVFEYQGKTYIFAEVYSLFRQRGAIGYCCYDGEKFSKWKTVIVEPYHMSYPFLMERDGEVYMIPETYGNGDVHVYRAVHFPEQWEPVHVMKSDVKYVDTTVATIHGTDVAFTYDIDAQPHRLLLFRLKDGRMDDYQSCVLSTDDAVARPGGYVFQKDGEWIRVSQDCDGQYGKAVVFSRIDSDMKTYYEEERVGYFGRDELCLHNPPKQDVTGIHTYTATDRMEVIDLKGKRISLIDLAVRLVLKIKQKIAR